MPTPFQTRTPPHQLPELMDASASLATLRGSLLPRRNPSHRHPRPMTSASTDLNWITTGTAYAETILFLHAVGYDLTYWDHQIAALSPHYNVLAVDLPGHGRSPGRPEDWTFPNAIQRLTTYLDAVNTGPIHLVGLSFGGMIAQHLALARPELLRSLSLLGTAAGFVPAVQDVMLARAAKVRTDGMQALLHSTLERHFTEDFRTRRPDVIDRVTKTLLADDPATHARIWELIAEDHNTTPRLSEITCPTLILVGEHDTSTPLAAARILAEGIPDTHLAVVPGAHIIPVESPDAVNRELLSFFAGLPH